MILIGMFDSPFVRRVAVSMNLLALSFEHRNWSIGAELELIRLFNPLGRVPTLVLPDGESLIDSSAILDYLDEIVGADRALLPRADKERRDVLRILALALGAAEKGVLQLYEGFFRPEEKRSEAWVQRCRHQMHGALAELDRIAQARAGDWLVGGRMTQADVTATCVFSYLNDALDLGHAFYPGLTALSSRCEQIPAFSAVRVKFNPPAQSGRPAERESAPG
jgi:glutathione S-transferase